MLTAGSILKKERLRRNYSLDEVSTATKIQKHYLESLENNDYAKFPSSVYAKGFLTNYAKFLGISPKRIIALYRRSVGEAPPQKIVEGPKPLKQPKFIMTPGIIIITIVVLVVIATFGYLIYQFYSFQKPPMLKITEPAANATVTESEVTLKGETDPGMFVTVNDEAVKVKPDGKFEVTINLSEGTNTVIIKSRHPDNIGKEAVITRNIEYEPEGVTEEESQESQDDSSSDSQEETEPSETIAIRVEIVDTTAWIEIEIDGSQVYASIAQPGEVLEFTANESATVITGRVSATKLFVNDQPQQLFIGESGVAAVTCEYDNSGDLSCLQP